jgi:hypothetical protein
LLVAAVAAMAWTAWLTRPADEGSASTETVVGVLPFVNATGDPSVDSLAAGLTDAIAKRLASIPTLHVVPLDETRAAREQGDGAVLARRETSSRADPVAIARDLGQRSSSMARSCSRAASQKSWRQWYRLTEPATLAGSIGDPDRSSNFTAWSLRHSSPSSPRGESSRRSKA